MRLALGEIRARVEQRGHLSRTIIVVNTLLDAEECGHADLADLYRQRWHVDLDVRSLKDVLGMGELRYKTPQRVRNEILMHFTAYNRIRRVMAAAGLEAGTAPRHVSFNGTLQTAGQSVLQDSDQSTLTCVEIGAREGQRRLKHGGALR